MLQALGKSYSPQSVGKYIVITLKSYARCRRDDTLPMVTAGQILAKQ